MLKEFISAVAFLLVLSAVITGFAVVEKNISVQSSTVETVIRLQNEAVLQ